MNRRTFVSAALAALDAWKQAQSTVGEVLDRAGIQDLNVFRCG